MEQIRRKLKKKAGTAMDKIIFDLNKIFNDNFNEIFQKMKKIKPNLALIWKDEIMEINKNIQIKSVRIELTWSEWSILYNGEEFVNILKTNGLDMLEIVENIRFKEYCEKQNIKPNNFIKQITNEINVFLGSLDIQNKTFCNVS